MGRGQKMARMPKKIAARIRNGKKSLRSAFIRVNYLRKMGHRSVYCSMTLPKHVGFTDQILLFGMLYKLGAYLKLKYHFTPLQPRANLLKSGLVPVFESGEPVAEGYRSIFEFLGVDWYFSQNHSCDSIDEFETIEFNFDQVTFDENGIDDLYDLIDHLCKLIMNTRPAGEAPLHIRFVLRQQIGALTWLHALPNTLLDFDFAEIYRSFRQQNAIPDVFENDKPKVLLHIRQGDTAVIETPWNTFIQIWPKGRDNFVERQTFAEVNDHQRISVADFEKFYSDLHSGLKDIDLSTLVHSDGFARAFFQLEKNIDRMNYNEEQVVAMTKHAASYNEMAFEVFRQHAEVKLFVGEELSLLFELMHAFYTADIVIIGTQQRMLAKQYAYSYSNGTGPLMITLYRQQRPYYNYFGNRSLLANCLYVDMDDYCISKVIEEAKQFLAGRYGGDIPGDRQLRDVAKPGYTFS